MFFIYIIYIKTAGKDMYTLNKNCINANCAFLIDKSILKKGKSYSFNLYGQERKNGIISLLCENDFILTEKMYKELITTRFIYIFNADKNLYEKYYMQNVQKVKKSLNLSNILNETEEITYKLFEDPESLNNLKDIQNSVTNTVSLILKDNSILSSALSIFSHDYYTHTHSVHVKIYSICLGKRLGLDKKALEELGTAALLHDLGKSKISKQILNKKEKLTNEEFLQIKKHPLFGYEIAKKLNINNKNILLGIRSHHEKIDGTGYPDGLKGNEIHLFAKIISICDIFDALSSKRSYKNPLSAFDTLLRMKKEMSNLIDIKILNEFILMLNSKA